MTGYSPAGPSTSVTVSKQNRDWLAEMQRMLAADRGLRTQQDTVDHVIAYLREVYDNYVRMIKDAQQ
jgi:sulfur relay (sulfurtransferase) DsrC/TusE family protein